MSLSVCQPGGILQNLTMLFSYYLSNRLFCYVCDVVCYRECEGEVNIHTPLALNQQALRMIGRQGPTVKVVGERNGELTISLAL